MSALQSVEREFNSSKGPAFYRFNSDDHFYRYDSGEEIETMLLDLDPRDLTREDIYPNRVTEYLPVWTTNEGLKWLIPGIVRVGLKEGSEDPKIFKDLFAELRSRLKEDSKFLTTPERNVLLEAYCVAHVAALPYEPLVEKSKLTNLLKPA